MNNTPLTAWAEKTIEWLERIAAQHEQHAETYRGHFDALADASRNDAANFRAIAKEGRAAVASTQKLP